MVADPVENHPELPAKPLYYSGGTWGDKPAPLRTHSALTAAFRHIQPSWRTYIVYVDMAARNGDESMKRYLAVFSSLTRRDQFNAWPEQVCELSGITPGELVGAVCRAVWESKSAESSMVSAIAHPKVLTCIAKLAEDPDNFRDRELFLRSTGSLPDKKGASINIFNTPTSAGTVKLVDAEVSGIKLKSFDEEVIEMSHQLPFVVDDNVPPEDH